MKSQQLSRASRGVAVLAVLFLLGAMMAGPAGTLAQDDVEVAAITPGTNAIVDDGPLNQRSGAGTNFPVLQVLAEGTVVEVLSGPTTATGFQWFQVIANNIAGYVAGIFLAEVGFQIGSVVHVASNTLNVRSGPGTSFSIVDTLDFGNTATIIDGPVSANGFFWYEIEYGTGPATGWVASAFIALSTNPPSGVFGTGSWILVEDGPVNIRSGAGTGFSVIGSLATGDAVVVVSGPTSANGHPWYEIETTANLIGYVAGTFFVGGFYLDSSAVVVDGPLNLRSSPGTGSSVLAVLAQNSTVAVLGTDPVKASAQVWFNVTSGGGVTGWVSGLYLGPN